MGKTGDPFDLLDTFFGTKPERPSSEDKPQAPVLQPALRQLGTTRCPICRKGVAVYLTKSNRPFINCGYCSARIFYNGRESMRRLEKVMKRVDGGVEL